MISKKWTPVTAEVEIERDGKRVRQSKTVLTEYEYCENLSDVIQLFSSNVKGGKRDPQWGKIEVTEEMILSSWGKDFQPGECETLIIGVEGGETTTLNRDEATRAVVDAINETSKRDAYSPTYQVLKTNLEGPDKAIERTADDLVKRARSFGNTLTREQALAIVRNNPEMVALFTPRA